MHVLGMLHLHFSEAQSNAARDASPFSQMNRLRLRNKSKDVFYLSVYKLFPELPFHGGDTQEISHLLAETSQ